ncbi:MAG: zinc ribbon domain-containing protein [Syntrophomonadaceae bacterium]|nr:zinc ribbon domain-containing protein [Syntrophomonadaceae bacterium]
MAFFNDLGKKIGNAAATAAEKTKEAAATAADKAKDTVEITKLNNAISAEEKNIAQFYSEIGKIFYDLEKNNPASPAAEQCTAISDAVDRIQEMKDKIVAIKEEDDRSDAPVEAPAAAAPVTDTSSKFCTECGTANGQETRFCQNCGKPLA